jgi:peptidoglycan hydrolase CwlO-like protein
MAESKGKDDQKLKKDKDKNTTQDSILAIQTQIENIRNSMPDDKKAKLAAQRRITSLQDRILTLRQSITEEGSTMLPQIRARLALAKPRRVHSA